MVKDGDRIVVDSEQRAINWLVDEEEQARRKKEWDASDQGQLKEKRGVLFRYARDVAVRDPVFWPSNGCNLRSLLAGKRRSIYRLKITDTMEKSLLAIIRKCMSSW